MIFSRHLENPQSTLESLLRPKVTSLPGHIQSVFVQNIIKLYAFILQEGEQSGDQDIGVQTGQLLVDKIPMFVQSSDLEVQERVSIV